jgi:hypothetical protein
MKEALKQSSHSKEYILEAKRYSGLNHAAATYSLGSNALNQRLYRGWNLSPLSS